MAYRQGDDGAGRLARHLEEVHRLLGRITHSYAEILAATQPGMFERLAELTGRVEANTSGEGLAPPDIGAIEPELAEIGDIVRQAIADAPTLRDELLALRPTLPADALGPTWPSDADTTRIQVADYRDRGSPGGTAITHRLARCLVRLDPTCRMMMHRHGVYRAHRIHLAGAPMALRVASTAMTADVSLRLTTTVPRAFAPMRLERQTWLHTFTKAVRIHVDARTGDREFDDHFLVTAHESAARRVLDGKVRRALMDVAHFATPTLALGDGLATLELSYDFSELLLERAAAVLATVRNRKVTLQLLDDS
jgi:hypothetical protein